MCFPDIIENARIADPDLVIHVCNALTEKGLLADVPVMLEAYGNLASNRDADVLAVFLSDVLHEGTGSAVLECELRVLGRVS